METAHIKDLLAHLKVLANPLDSISWHRVLLMMESIGPKTAQEILESIAASGKGLRGLSDVKVKPRCAPALEKLRGELEDLSRAPMPLVEIGTRILEYYEPILEKKYDDYPKRLKDLEQLITIMERYQSLEEFLSDMALEPPNTSVDNVLAAGNEDEKLILSTIHSAKGLEWHTVFIIWALEGRFPVSFATHRDEDMEEERRLMYVAATRAKENLYFTCPTYVHDWNTGGRYSRPSRFIDGIPEHILEPWSLVID